MITDEQIGAAVARLRGDRAQREVAEEMRALGWKWSQTTVWKVETGERALRLAEAVDLESVLGASLELMGDGEGPDIPSLRLEFRRALDDFRAAHARFEHAKTRFERARERLADAAGSQAVLSAMQTTVAEFNDAIPFLFTPEEVGDGVRHEAPER